MERMKIIHKCQDMSTKEFQELRRNEIREDLLSAFDAETERRDKGLPADPRPPTNSNSPNSFIGLIWRRICPKSRVIESRDPVEREAPMTNYTTSAIGGRLELNRVVCELMVSQRYDEALRLEEDHLAATRQESGTDSMAYAQALVNIAGLYSLTGRHADAVLMFKQAIALFETHEGPPFHQANMAMCHLALILRKPDGDEEADKLMKKVKARQMAAENSAKH